jgi:hypothetical protein
MIGGLLKRIRSRTRPRGNQVERIIGRGPETLTHITEKGWVIDSPLGWGKECHHLGNGALAPGSQRLRPRHDEFPSVVVNEPRGSGMSASLLYK